MGNDVTPPAFSLMNFIADAVNNPNIDVSKLDALLRMQREVMADAAQAQFIAAMSACQSEIEPVARNVQNEQTRSMFAKLETVDAMARPIYTRHGFSLSFDEEVTTGELMVIVCEVSHRAGHSKKYRLVAPPDVLGPKGSATKTALHGRGSTITFLRRYLECNIFNIVLKNQDDDGVRGGMASLSPLSRAQIAELRALIATTGSNEQALVNYYADNRIDTLDEVPASWFAKLKNGLETKRQRQTDEKPHDAPVQ